MSSKWSSPKELLVLAVLMAVGLGSAVGVLKLGAHFGISRWTTLASALAVFLVAVAVSQWRKLHPPNRPGLVLVTCGISALAILSIVNEFVMQFFTPTRFDLLAAMLPSIAYELFRYVKSKRARPDDESH